MTNQPVPGKFTATKLLLGCTMTVTGALPQRHDVTQ